jgi:uroporphyrin-3 C-methyltransferase
MIDKEAEKKDKEVETKAEEAKNKVEGPEKTAVDQDAKLSDAFDRLEKKADDENVAGPKSSAKVRTKSKSTPKSRSSVGVVIAVFLSLVAIGVASYPTFVLYTQQASDPVGEMTSRVTALQQEQEGGISQVNSSLDSLSGKLTGLERNQSAALKSLQQALESDIADLQSADGGTTSQDWLLAEVEYLLRMANQRVLMERDPAGALGLIEAADSIIADSQGLTAFSLRQAMATDMARLEAVEVLDKEGLYLRLSALTGQVNSLKQHELAYVPPTEAAELSAQEPTILGGMMAFVSKVFIRITSLVDYRRDGIDVTPILPPDQEYYLRQNLILKLQMAQIALLDNNGEIFSLSLQECKAWIEKYFDAGDNTTIAMQTALDELMTINVQEELPDVSGSLREIRALLTNFHRAEAIQ